MRQLDAGWMCAFGVFRLGLGINAGGGYMASTYERGSLYLFSLALSLNEVGIFVRVPFPSLE